MLSKKFPVYACEYFKAQQDVPCTFDMCHKCYVEKNMIDASTTRRSNCIRPNK